MNNKKTAFIRLLTCVVLVFAAVVLLSCVQNNNPGEDLPRATSLEITSPPAKTVYLLNEQLELSGCSVTVRYDSGADELFYLPHEGFSVFGFSSQTTGKKTVTVSFDGTSNTFSVYVTDGVQKIPSSMQLVTPPSASTYYVGDTLNLAGCTVKVFYIDGTSAVFSLPDSTFTVSGFSSAAVGAKTVKITLGEFFVEFPVTVLPKVVPTALTLLTPPDTVDYMPGEALSLLGLSVRIDYSDDTNQVVSLPDSRFTVSGFSSNTPGEKTVTVSLGSLSVSFTVNVADSPAIAALRSFFSDYSYIEYSANLVMTAEERAAAYLAYTTFNTLTTDLMAILDVQIRDAVVAAAFWAYRQNYLTVFNAVTPYLSADGFNTKSVSLIEGMISPLGTVCQLSGTLLGFGTYGTVTLYGNVTVGSILLGMEKSLSTDKEQLFAPALFAAKSFILLNNLGAQGEHVTSGAALAPYKASIETAYNLFTEQLLDKGQITPALKTRFATYYLPMVQYFIPDYLNVFYTHYFYIGNQNAMTLLTSYEMPQIITDIITAIDNALYAQGMMAFGISGVKTTDATEFLLHYRTAARLIEQLAADGSIYTLQIYTKLLLDVKTKYGMLEGGTLTLSEWFEALTANSLLYRYSYEYIVGELAGDEIFESFLDSYLEVAQKYLTDPDYRYGHSEFNHDTVRIYEEFLALDAIYQLNFYFIININYSPSVTIVNSSNIFNTLLLSFFNNRLTNDNQRNMYSHLRLAEEAYIFLVANAVNSSYYADVMSNLNKYYDGLSLTNQQAVQNYLSTPYKLYADRYAAYQKGIQQLDQFNSLINTMLTSGASGDYAFAFIYFDSLTALYNQIRSDGAVMELFNTVSYTGYTELQTYFPLSTWYAIAQNYHALLTEEFFGAEIYDPVFADFLSRALAIIRTGGACSKAEMDGMLNAFISITPYQQYLFFDFSYSRFTLSVETYFKPLLTTAELALLRGLLSTVSQRYTWRYIPGIASYLECVHYFIDGVYSYIEYYNELAEINQVVSFDGFHTHLGVLYDFYMDECAALLIECPPSPTDVPQGIIGTILQQTMLAATAKYNLETFPFDNVYYDDATPFMIEYRNLTQTINSLTNPDDIAAYNSYVYDGRTLSEWYDELTNSFMGYNYHMGEFLSDEDYNIFYFEYLNVANRYASQADYRAGNNMFNNEISNLHGLFNQLSAAKQIQFFRTLDIYYRLFDTYKTEQAGALVKGNNLFYIMLTEYYSRNTLSSAAMLTVRHTLYLQEIFAWHSLTPEHTSFYLSVGKAAKANYTALSASDKKQFDDSIGSLYANLIGEYERVDKLLKNSSAYTNSINKLLTDVYAEYNKMANCFGSYKATANYDTAVFVVLYMRLSNEIADILSGADYDKLILYYNYSFGGYLADLLYDLTYADYGYLWFMDVVDSDAQLSAFYGKYIDVMYRFYFDPTYRAKKTAEFCADFLSIWHAFYSMDDISRMFFYIVTNVTYSGAGFWEKDIMFNLMAREYFAALGLTNSQTIAIYRFFETTEAAANYALYPLTFDAFIQAFDALMLSFATLEQAQMSALSELTGTYYSALLAMYNSILNI